MVIIVNADDLAFCWEINRCSDVHEFKTRLCWLTNWFGNILKHRRSRGSWNLLKVIEIGETEVKRHLLQQYMKESNIPILPHIACIKRPHLGICLVISVNGALIHDNWTVVHLLPLLCAKLFIWHASRKLYLLYHFNYCKIPQSIFNTRPMHQPNERDGLKDGNLS